MAINIKNERTNKLVQKLAKVTGESMTTAITEAVRERLERVQSDGGSELQERLLKIGEDCARRLKEPYRTANHGELLYDEKGLPQ